MQRVLVELCAGSAGLTTWLCNEDPMVSYAGSKFRYAERIAQIMGLTNGVDRFWLNDPGVFGGIWKPMSSRDGREGVARYLEALKTEPPRELFDSIWERVQQPGISEEECAALLLCRIAGTYGGKERGGFKGLHKRRPNVDGYIPSRNSIYERVKRIQFPENAITVTREDARTVDVAEQTRLADRVYIYIDPPYRGSESVYEHRLPRDDLITLVQRCCQMENVEVVAISEAEPLLPWLHSIAHQSGTWECHNISGARWGQNRRNSKTDSEYLTLWKRQR